MRAESTVLSGLQAWVRAPLEAAGEAKTPAFEGMPGAERRVKRRCGHLCGRETFAVAAKRATRCHEARRASDAQHSTARSNYYMLRTAGACYVPGAPTQRASRAKVSWVRTLKRPAAVESSLRTGAQAPRTSVGWGIACGALHRRSWSRASVHDRLPRNTTVSKSSTCFGVVLQRSGPPPPQPSTTPLPAPLPAPAPIQ